ncbi:hypothetical protein [Halobacillus seohaensis]|uniref:ABC transporter permease n=1 Tax=Halobacillus seohaensis TaxID=447421 RepID=A0ABW2EQP3_9BACI
MKSISNIPKITLDMYWFNMRSALWFSISVFIVYISLRYFLGHEIGNEFQQNFFSFAYQPSKIYMLIMGILSVFAFLTFYIRHGVTRKDYFIGTALSSLGISITLLIIMGGMAAVHQMFATTDTIMLFGEDTSWLTAVLAFGLNVFMYYIAGWLIGAGFYRLGGLGGTAFILLAIGFVAMVDNLWEYELGTPVKILTGINLDEMPLYISFIGTLLLIGLALWIVRVSTKRIVIKMK